MIEEIIYDILSNDDELKNIVGEQVYHLLSPNDKDGVYVIYSFTGEPTYTKSTHPTYTDYIIDFRIYSHLDIVSVINAQNRIQNLLETCRNTTRLGFKISNTKMVNWEEGMYEDGFVERTMTFSMRVNN